MSGAAGTHDARAGAALRVDGRSLQVTHSRFGEENANYERFSFDLCGSIERADQDRAERSASVGERTWKARLRKQAGDSFVTALHYFYIKTLLTFHETPSPRFRPR